MDTLAFLNAIDEAFPQLDQPHKKEIYQKILIRMVTILQENVYSKGQRFDERINNEADPEKRAELYLNQVVEKFDSLPPTEQKKIAQELDIELDKIMQEMHKTYSIL